MLYISINLFQSLRVRVLLLLPAGLQIFIIQGLATYPYDQHHHIQVHHDQHLPDHQGHSCHYLLLPQVLSDLHPLPS